VDSGAKQEIDRIFTGAMGRPASVIVLLIINWWGRDALGRTCHIITWA
jgi:hypothetical protein